MYSCTLKKMKKMTGGEKKGDDTKKNKKNMIV
jgi:hypothetical protein